MLVIRCMAVAFILPGNNRALKQLPEIITFLDEYADATGITHYPAKQRFAAAPDLLFGMTSINLKTSVLNFISFARF